MSALHTPNQGTIQATVRGINGAEPQANYVALVEVLERLYRIPDGLGETILNYDEAAAIRACGFGARAQCTWRCPALPNSLVEWHPLLHHLSDAIDSLSHAAGWKQKRAPSRHAGRAYPLARIEQKIMAHLTKQPYYLSKRRLQQQMWRYPATFFNRTISRMIRQDRITLHEGVLFPYSRINFAECVQLSLRSPKQLPAASYTARAQGSTSWRERR